MLKRPSSIQRQTQLPLWSDGAAQLTAAQLRELTAGAKAAGKDLGDYLLSLHRASLNGQHVAATHRSATAWREVHSTQRGSIIQGDSRHIMATQVAREAVSLIMTSPPYALVFKKDYGNEDADRYLDWFKTFVPGFIKVLKPNGSLVIDIGGVWKKGRPTRSLYHFELLVMLCREYGLHLAQEFYWWNPAKLPTPAEWVNVRRIRVKDAVNCVWWLSRSEYPKASNRRVLQPYSADMQRLLKRGYRNKPRPSGHNISTKFLSDNKGSIPPNVIALGNNDSNSAHRRYCQEHGLVEHPAQFPPALPAFFIQMLTDPGDFVLDPFAGSCVTGAVSEQLDRKWMCVELLDKYAESGRARFLCGGREQLRLRREPYEIYPPIFGVADHDEPLPKDGGRRTSRSSR
jgi:site-specific DNA-methyltransferase (cytosine-N4-specific)